jgi:hypothetical protein
MVFRQPLGRKGLPRRPKEVPQQTSKYEEDANGPSNTFASSVKPSNADAYRSDIATD